jgi:hypothetical protein
MLDFDMTGLALASFVDGNLQQTIKELPPLRRMETGRAVPLVIAYNKALWALLAVLEGRLDQAEKLARESLAHPSNVEGAFLGHWACALMHIGRNDLSAAAQQIATALTAVRLAGAGYLTRALPVAAFILASRGRPEWATQILSLAQNHPASQIGWSANWQPGADLRPRLEEELGQEAFQTAWAAGKSLDLVEAAARVVGDLTNGT